MIILSSYSDRFENDVRALITAFCPGEEIRLLVRDREDIPSQEWLREADDAKELVIKVFQNQEKIILTVFVQGELVSEDTKQLDSYVRRDVKDQLKLLVYSRFSKVFSKTLPWGTLTGIRPTKLARVMLQEKKSAQEIEDYMKQHYLTSDKKAKLSVNIASKELSVLEGINYKEQYSLYVGIPFCPSTCAYCSFTSYPAALWKDSMEEYIDKLCMEIAETIRLFGADRVTTIYIGGGTPTSLSAELLGRLLAFIRKETIQSNVLEFTVEAGRPDSITKEKLRALQAHGISRISINPQTMQQETLDRIGRRHTVQQILTAYQLARSMGFDNINMDLIAGLPGEGMNEVTDTMRQIQALGPDSLTVHSLAIKRAAGFNLFPEKYKQTSDINIQEIIDMTGEYAASIGMEPYYLYRQKNMAGNLENIGYARQAKAGLYNILIMEELHTIAAAGAGASTKIVDPVTRAVTRVENVKDVRSYLDRTQEMITRKADKIRWRALNN